LLVRDQEARQQLIDAALDLLANQQQRQQLSAELKKLGKPTAARDIAEEVRKLVQ